jgi:formylmethanofuran dehydrogenase subunit E
MIQAPEIFQRIYQQHGHRCPMSTLGGRMGLAALKSLGVESGSGLTVVFEHGTCAVDGIEITTGCSRSAGTLRVEDSGRHSLVMRSGQGQSARISLNESALATAWKYRTANEAFNAGKETLPADELKVLYEQKEAVLQTVLEKFWTLPDEILLTVEMV